MSCILRWARLAIVVAGKGRGGCFYFFCFFFFVFFFVFFFTFIPVPLSSMLLSFISSTISSISFLQEVAGSTPAKVGNIFSWRLIMKYFLRSLSPFR